MVAKFKYSRWARIYSTDEQSITDKIWDMTKKRNEEEATETETESWWSLNSEVIFEIKLNAIEFHQWRL